MEVDLIGELKLCITNWNSMHLAQLLGHKSNDNDLNCDGECILFVNHRQAHEMHEIYVSWKIRPIHIVTGVHDR